LGATLDVELSKDPINVIAHRLVRKAEMLGDETIGKASRNHFQDFHLAWRQARETCVWAR